MLSSQDESQRAPQAGRCLSVPSPLGRLAIIWQDSTRGARVRRILLPGEAARALRTGDAAPASRNGEAARALLYGEAGHEATPPRAGPAGAAPGSNPAIEELADLMQRYLGGQAVELPLDLIDLEACSGFQRRVLLAEYAVPRGRVSSYGRLAAGLGAPSAARAVGSALARNPFPIIIPCHRTVRSDGDLGGFRGGLDMKRALLELEGVELTPAGTVPARFFC